MFFWFLWNLRKISPDELLAYFAGVHFRADIALERAKLEDGLLGFMQQMLGTVWHSSDPWDVRKVRPHWKVLGGELPLYSWGHLIFHYNLTLNCY